jgi:hypothetical protein
LNLLSPRQLSGPASDLVQFDADSIRQIAKPDEPDFWIADPDKYERNGRLLRDSESARMLAYSSTRQMLYATDGCNACATHVPPDQLKSVPNLPEELLNYLAADLTD